jgi:hypothetical protein
MRTSLFFICLAITTNLFSQDFLYKKDGTVIPVKEVHSTLKTISYKIYNDTTDFKYNISVMLVDSIVYSSGALTNYNSFKYEIDKKSLVGMGYPNPYTFSFDFYELIFLYNINIGYEYMFVRPQIGLSLTFTRSLYRNYVNKNDNYIDIWDLFRSPEYGFKFSFNYYAINTTKINYGLRLVNYTFIYQGEIYDWNHYNTTVETSTSSLYGLGVFALYRFTNSVYGLAALEVYFYNKNYFSIYFLPQIAIGVNF